MCCTRIRRITSQALALAGMMWKHMSSKVEDKSRGPWGLDGPARRRLSQLSQSSSTVEDSGAFAASAGTGRASIASGTMASYRTGESCTEIYGVGQRETGDVQGYM